MKRIALTGSSSWFDVDAATRFNESETWNGSNNISDATRSQTEHEVLFRTASGRWVLECWSQWQGHLETFEIIDNKAAAAWLVINGHNSDIVATEIAALEL